MICLYPTYIHKYNILFNDMLVSYLYRAARPLYLHCCTRTVFKFSYNIACIVQYNNYRCNNAHIIYSTITALALLSSFALAVHLFISIHI